MKLCLKSWAEIHQTSCDFYYGGGAFVSYPISTMTQPSRNFFVLTLFCAFMHVCWLKVQGFESSVNNDFRKENDVLIQMKRLKIIKTPS
jgi:hypothetical protein